MRLADINSNKKAKNISRRKKKMRFTNGARTYGNFTRTENGAVALRSTGSDLLDLFATVGALRGKDASYVSNAFQLALAEDKLLATKLMFYARNVRGGLGERDVFRKMLVSLAKTNPEIVSKNLAWIPFFGRWDDLYVLVGTENEIEMWGLISRTINGDIEEMKAGKPVTLCAKWLKSINTSSRDSVSLGKKTAWALGMSEKQYRKTLSALRRHIDLVEVKMSAKEWYSINYEALPSRAMKNYRNALKTHNPNAFEKFITKVEKGEAKINASTLYPYDILMGAEMHSDANYRYGMGSYNQHPKLTMKEDRVLEAQWKALPNYVEGENNVLVMADTSGSMESDNGRPIATSVGLAIYFAERNKGAYKDLFMTFDGRPEFINLKGTTLKSKVECVPCINANTDLEAGFNLILKVALDNNVPQEEMPKTLIIISDMHFDQATGRNDMTFHESMKRKFGSHGYEMPTIIYWNVAQRESAFQLSQNSANTMLVSGQSTSTFKSILGNIGRTPYEFMVETLNSKEYDCIKI